MKTLIIIVMLLIAAMPGMLMAQVRVKGYTKKNGTYVAPHQRTRPNKTKTDNYSYKGNKTATKPRKKK